MKLWKPTVAFEFEPFFLSSEMFKTIIYLTEYVLYFPVKKCTFWTLYTILFVLASYYIWDYCIRLPIY